MNTQNLMRAATTTAALLLVLGAMPAHAQTNAGQRAPETDLPFTMTQVATFNLPWRIAFLPDGRMLVDRKTGRCLADHPAGREDTGRDNVPAVLHQGQAV